MSASLQVDSATISASAATAATPNSMLIRYVPQEEILDRGIPSPLSPKCSTCNPVARIESKLMGLTLKHNRLKVQPAMVSMPPINKMHGVVNLRRLATSMGANARNQTARRSTASAFKWVFCASRTAVSAATARTPRQRFRREWAAPTSSGTFPSTSTDTQLSHFKQFYAPRNG